MRLLCHNMLQCHIKGVVNGYPLKIEAEKVETRETDYEPDFLRHIFPRIQWDALREAAAAMGKRRRRAATATIGSVCICSRAATWCDSAAIQLGLNEFTAAPHPPHNLVCLQVWTICRRA